MEDVTQFSPGEKNPFWIRYDSAYHVINKHFLNRNASQIQFTTLSFSILLYLFFYFHPFSSSSTQTLVNPNDRCQKPKNESMHVHVAPPLAGKRLLLSIRKATRKRSILFSSFDLFQVLTKQLYIYTTLPKDQSPFYYFS